MENNSASKTEQEKINSERREFARLISGLRRGKAGVPAKAVLAGVSIRGRR